MPIESFKSVVILQLYTANFYPMKTTGTGNYGVPAGKSALSMEKGCKNHKETLCMLWINPVIFTGFPHNKENLQRPSNAL